MVNLEQSGSQNLDAWSVVLTCSLTVTLNYLKTELKIFNTALVLLTIDTTFVKKTLIFCQKIVYINKIKEVLLLKGILSETTNVRVLTK